MSLDLQNCREGNHEFIVIQHVGSDMEQKVVRWCRICGSIVVDLDVDGRTKPGGVMSIRAPETYYRKND